MQIEIAAGQKLRKKEFKPRGHAIECRINAEDPEHDFRPSPGEITSFHLPGGFGVRVDTHCYEHYRIPPFYDSLIAKLIVFAPTRDEAIRKMSGALEEFTVEGIHTTIPFHRRVMKEDIFKSGHFDTSYVEKVFFHD